MITITGLSNRTLETTRLQTALRTSFGSPVVELATLPPSHTTHLFLFYFNSSIIAYNTRKGKAPQVLHNPSIALTNQPTDESPGPSAQGPVSIPLRSPSPAFTEDDITQLVAQQLAVVQSSLAQLVAKQVALALKTLKVRESQTPSAQGNYERKHQDTAISLGETLVSQGTRSQDGPIQCTDAQELSDGIDPTFEAWRLQVLAHFRDDPS